MQAVPDIQITVECIGCNWKTVCIRQYLAERRTTYLAEASAVYVRRHRLKKLNMLLALDPFEIVLSDENDGAGSNFAAPGTMASSHHRWLAQKLEFDCTTAATSFDHQPFPNLRCIHQKEQYMNIKAGTTSEVIRCLSFKFRGKLTGVRGDRSAGVKRLWRRQGGKHYKGLMIRKACRKWYRPISCLQEPDKRLWYQTRG